MPHLPKAVKFSCSSFFFFHLLSLSFIPSPSQIHTHAHTTHTHTTHAHHTHTVHLRTYIDPVMESSVAYVAHAMAMHSPDIATNFSSDLLPLIFLGMHAKPGPDDDSEKRIHIHMISLHFTLHESGVVRLLTLYA